MGLRSHHSNFSNNIVSHTLAFAAGVVITVIFQLNSIFDSEIYRSSNIDLLRFVNKTSASAINKTFPKDVNNQSLNGGVAQPRSGGLDPKVFRQIHVYANERAPDVKSYSQEAQDLVIMKLLKAHTDKGGESGSFFVDLAANDAMQFSNTLHLEQNGWHGLCIEGNHNYWYRLASLRKCTVIGAFVGGETDGDTVDVKISNGIYGGIVGFDNKGGDGTKRQLLSIVTLFKDMAVPKVIDYLSLDVEGAEYFVMEHFPFEKYMFRFLTIERPSVELQELLGKHGYKKTEKDVAQWGETLWFNPNATLLTNEEVATVSGLDKCWTFKNPNPDPNCS